MADGKIYTLIPKIMREIGAIEKNRKNSQQGYTFRGIDDVYNALHDPLAINGVFYVPEVLESKVVERASKSGGILVNTVVKMRFQFFADDGSSVSVTTIGEGMDSGDKSSNKAMSAALKYALVQMFCIPTADEKDSENDSHEVAPQIKPSNFSVHPKNGKPWSDGSDTGLNKAYAQLGKEYQEEIGKVLTARGYVFSEGAWIKLTDDAPEGPAFRDAKASEVVTTTTQDDPYAGADTKDFGDEQALPLGGK